MLTKRMAGLALAVVMVVVACGGDDDSASDDAAVEPAASDDDTATADPPADQPADEPAPEPEPEPEPDSDSDSDSDSGSDSGDGSSSPGTLPEGATATIDGEELTFDDAVVCVTINDALAGQWFSADGSVSLSVDLPPQDWETNPDDWSAPSVRLDDERDPSNQRTWRAGGEVVDGFTGVPPEVMVDEFRVADRAATGRATVVELNALTLGEPLVTEMTFTVSCGE